MNPYLLAYSAHIQLQKLCCRALGRNPNTSIIGLAYVFIVIKGQAVSEHIVLIGANGWQHSEWIGDFYPDDLPEEWLLGYYGNEYPVVMVPADYLQSDSAVINEWLEESDESLRLLIEWPAGEADETVRSKWNTAVSLLSERIVGILVPLNEAPDDSSWTQLQDLAKQFPISFDLGAEPDAELEAILSKRFSKQNANICWHGMAEREVDMNTGRIGLCRLSGEIEPKELRRIIQSMVNVSRPERSLVLIVDGQPPDMKLLTNAGIILDLL